MTYIKPSGSNLMFHGLTGPEIGITGRTRLKNRETESETSILEEKLKWTMTHAFYAHMGGSAPN